MQGPQGDEGPLSTLPAPEEDGSEPTLEEKIVEYEQKQKLKKKHKKPKPQEHTKGLKSWVDLFRPREKGAGQMFVLVGKSERGKTHCLRWLLYSMCLREPKFRFGIVFVRTKFKSAYNFHWSTAHHCLIYEGFDMDVLKQFVSNLKQRFLDRKGMEPRIEPSFIVFDDLVGVPEKKIFMSNFFATYRHYSITIFIAVQYLTGRNAVSPIMREQTSYCLMFNSKVYKTNENLWLSFGQAMAKKDFFQHLQRCTDERDVGTKHAFCLYMEHVDRLELNYISMVAPPVIPDGEVLLKGPLTPKPLSQSERQKRAREAQFAYKAPSWLPQSMNLSAKDHDMLQKLMFLGDRAKQRSKQKGTARRDKEALKQFDDSVQRANQLAAQRWRQQQQSQAMEHPRYNYAYTDAGQQVVRFRNLNTMPKLEPNPKF